MLYRGWTLNIDMSLDGIASRLFRLSSTPRLCYRFYSHYISPLREPLYAQCHRNSPESQLHMNYMLGLHHGLSMTFFSILSRAYYFVMSRFANQALVSLGMCSRERSIFTVITGTLAANDDKHAKGLKALADSFRADHTVSHKRESIEEAISAYEQVLQLRPLGHEMRAEAVSDLGEALHAFCSHNGTDDTRAH
jgi:hypothetical protein